jgi:hypothetical protein
VEESLHDLVTMQKTRDYYETDRTDSTISQ